MGCFMICFGTVLRLVSGLLYGSFRGYYVGCFLGILYAKFVLEDLGCYCLIM